MSGGDDEGGQLPRWWWFLWAVLLSCHLVGSHWVFLCCPVTWVLLGLPLSCHLVGSFSAVLSASAKPGTSYPRKALSVRRKCVTPDRERVKSVSPSLGLPGSVQVTWWSAEAWRCVTGDVGSQSASRPSLPAHLLLLLPLHPHFPPLCGTPAGFSRLLRLLQGLIL